MSKFKNKSLSQKIVIMVVIALIFLTIVDFTPIGGNWKLYANWIRCGQMPVATNLEWQFVGSVPSYGMPPLVDIMRGSEYYCTPLEAEKAGYSANPNQYQFPHLEKERTKSES